MKLERDPFRIQLRSAKLCMELDCDTVFDSKVYTHCPTCGSLEFYPLEVWLNRERGRRARHGDLAGRIAGAAAELKSASRSFWPARARETERPERNRRGAALEPVALLSRVAQRRNVG